MMIEIKVLVLLWMILAVNCWRSGYEERKCKSAGERFENGMFTDLRGDIRRYHCKENYVSNIPNLERMLFRCRFERRLGLFEWIAMASRFTHGGSIFLSNVKCKAKKSCVDPFIPGNMTRKITARYQNEVTIRGREVDLNGFFTGDTIEYNCRTGYALSNELGETYYQYFDYNNYGHYYDETLSATTTEAPATKTLLKDKITCDGDGFWNGIPNSDIYFGKCQEILCDATRFVNIRNGNITNYKEKYGFFEEMKLECEDGFIPKDGILPAVCTTSSSFDEIFLSDFGCKPIQCIELESPLNGHLRIDHNFVNGTALFGCESGYKMIGTPKWQCQPNGKWDHDCVRCTHKNEYCPSPCLPTGATVIPSSRSYNIGDVLEYTCKSGRYYGGSTNRTCMKNKHLSGTPIDCIGTSLFKPSVGRDLLSAMRMISEYRPEHASQTDVAMSKRINVETAQGVDVYLLVDISMSITTGTLNLTRKLLLALLPKLGIDDSDNGTRLALTYFGSEPYRVFDRHMFHSEDKQPFKSYKEVMNEIKMDQNFLQKVYRITKYGTAITTALEDITVQVGTKEIRFKIGDGRLSHQVLILISDGRFTSMGDPTYVATYLKERFAMEIYSIAIVDKTDIQGSRTMEKLASHIEDEQHFFRISRDESDFKTVLESMGNTA